MSEKEKLNTAYHEAGHAIVGYLVPEHDPVYKVTIIPRGRALGVTMYLPEEDRYSISRQGIESQIASLFGGRIAEEMINGADGVTTGASNDIERATELARNMVTKWGLSDRLGPLTYSEDDGEVFLGRSVTQHKQVSDDTAHAIDEEVRRIIDTNYSRAKKLLEENLEKLHSMAKALIKYETIDEHQIKDIMAGREPRPPEDWDDSTGSASKDDEPAPICLINPELVWRSRTTIKAEEGCLSLPKQFAEVSRAEQVRVRHLDRAGATQEVEAEGLLARCLQHEIDHLDGILFTDHLSALKRNMILRRLIKQRRARD